MNSFRDLQCIFGLSEWATRERIARMVRAGELKVFKKGSFKMYRFAQPYIKPHDPFNLCRKGKA